MTEGAYVAKWIITALLGAAALRTTALFLFNSVKALKSREPAVRSHHFVEIEAYILASPWILIRLLLIFAIKGPNAYREVKNVRRSRKGERKDKIHIQTTARGNSNGAAQSVRRGGRARIEEATKQIPKKMVWTWRAISCQSKQSNKCHLYTLSRKTHLSQMAWALMALPLKLETLNFSLAIVRHKNY